MTEALSMFVSVTIHGIYLELDVPSAFRDVEAEIEELKVKVFMYENDRK